MAEAIHFFKRRAIASWLKYLIPLANVPTFSSVNVSSENLVAHQENISFLTIVLILDSCLLDHDIKV